MVRQECIKKTYRFPLSGMQIPGQMLLVALNLFPTLNVEAAEAAVRRLQPKLDPADCIFDTDYKISNSSSSLSELSSLASPGLLCGLGQQPDRLERPSTQSRTGWPDSHSQSSNTTVSRLHHAAGRAGQLAAAHRTHVPLSSRSTSAEASQDALGGPKVDSDQSQGGLFEQQAQGNQQHNIEFRARFHQACLECAHASLYFKAHCPWSFFLVHELECASSILTPTFEVESLRLRLFNVRKPPSWSLMLLMACKMQGWVDRQQHCLSQTAAEKVQDCTLHVFFHIINP